MTPVSELRGVGTALAQALAAQGIETAEDLARADLADLHAIKGIGRARAPGLQDAAKSAIRPGRKPAMTAPVIDQTAALKAAEAARDKAQAQAAKARAKARKAAKKAETLAAEFARAKLKAKEKAKKVKAKAKRAIARERAKAKAILEGKPKPKSKAKKKKT